jgi:translation initiation factor IF-2
LNKIHNFANIFQRLQNIFVNQDSNMTEGTAVLRLSKIAREFNIGTSTIVEFLAKKGISIDTNPNTKISQDAFDMLAKEFQKEKSLKDEVRKTGLSFTKRESISLPDDKQTADPSGKPAGKKHEDENDSEEQELFIKDIKSSMVETAKPDEEILKEPGLREKIKLSGPKILGKLDADQMKGKSVPPAAEQQKPVAEEPKSVEPKSEPGKEVVAEVAPVKEIPVEPEPAKEEKEVKAHKSEEVQTPPSEPVESPKVEKPVVSEQAIPEPQEQIKEEKPEPAKPEVSEQISEEATPVAEKNIPPLEEKPVEADSRPSEPFVNPDIEDVHSPELAIPEPEKKAAGNFYKTEVKKLEGVTILGRIELPAAKDKNKKPVASSSADAEKPKKRKRKRIRKEKVQEGSERTTTAADSTAQPSANQSDDQRKASPRGGNDHQKGQQQKRPQQQRPPQQGATPQSPSQSQTSQSQSQQSQAAKGKRTPRKDFVKPEVSDEEISRQIRETLASLSGTGKSKAAKHRKQKRDVQHKQRLHDQQQAVTDQKTLKVTEFVSANELSSLMNVSVVEVISTCMSLGLVVSINQRLDAETITIVADEFGYEVEFISVDAQEIIREVEDTPDQLKSRAPIVTVMGHVDHGKTSLLDHIRHANVIAGEAGGITQHIGAYSVQLEDGKMITFLDTPGHEAFTAMRARGAKVTDVAIIVVAADDNVMPQTIEAINHAQAAGVPLVIAINKIDKANANVEKVKEELAKINILVEDWGGKYQSQEISAKNGINIDKLLEKVLLEAEMLDMKANPDKNASGTVIESSLDKGRGYLATILVQNGTLGIGDIVVAGNTHGRIKAMFNERNIRITEAGPATPALILGLDGAPQAGDTFHVVKDEQEAKAITSKRQQLIREQGLRTQKHITLDEIGRRIAIGDFKELNIIIKGDVDGSVEALADSLLKLSTGEVQVNIIHKAVGSITEGDVLLASASNAIIVGFQVRPSMAARKLAENEEIDIRIYSVIYNAINEIKSAIEGMLSPDIEEKIVANIEVRETFKITKVGTVAGCLVLDGKIHRNSKIRVIRDGIVVYSGYLGSLKRFKDDVKEVSSGYECGLNIDRFNDMKVGDIIEAYEIKEIARKLE